jgi:hypothetical protein
MITVGKAFCPALLRLPFCLRADERPCGTSGEPAGASSYISILSFVLGRPTIGYRATSKPELIRKAEPIHIKVSDVLVRL